MNKYKNQYCYNFWFVSPLFIFIQEFKDRHKNNFNVKSMLMNTQYKNVNCNINNKWEGRVVKKLRLCMQLTFLVG